MLRPKAPLRYAARQAPLSLLVFFVHSTLISWARSNAVRTGSNIRFEIHDSSSLLRPQYGRLLHHGFPLSFISPPQAPAPRHSPSSGENGNGPFARRRRRKAKSDLESVGRNQNVKTKRSSKVQPFSPINELAISTATTSFSSSKHFFFDFSVPKGHNGMAFPAHPAKMTEQGPAAPARSPNTLLEPPSSHAKTLAGGWHQIWTSLAGGEMPPPEGGEGGGGNNLVFKVLLAAVALIYGTNFGAIKYLDAAHVDVSIVTAIRFALATLSLCPFLYKAPMPVVMRGLEVGMWVAAGYIAQAIGLQTTQSSKSAFICSLAVVVVPIVNAIVYKRKAPPTAWLAAVLAVLGVGLMTLEGKGTPPSIGDLWSMGQPLGFGIAFVRSEQCMQENKSQALAMTAAQMVAVMAVSMLWVSFTLTANTPSISALYEPVNMAALFYTGVVTSALAVVGESIALAHISAEETTVILSTEPLWAALFGAMLLGEKMNGFGYLGGATILLGCLLTQLKLPKGLEKLLGPWEEGGEA